jgi:YbbR domain-containing protein
MGRFRELLLEDFWIKAFSLVFAVFLWMSIVGGESVEELFVVPVTITNIPENMIISDDIVDFVNVRVRGQRGILNTLSAKTLDVELDLKDLEEGDNTVTLFPEEVKLPEGVTAIRVSPSLLPIKLSRLTEKWLPVSPSFLGAPASGYKVGEVTVSPSKVAVTGLGEALKDQVRIETRHIELFGRDRPFSVAVGLKPLNGNVYIKGPETVNVTIEIVERTVNREFEDVPVKLNGPSSGVTYKPDRVTLVVSGPESRITKILPSLIQVEIPKQSKPGTFELKPNIILPQGFQLVRMEPETISVKVKR